MNAVGIRQVRLEKPKNVDIEVRCVECMGLIALSTSELFSLVALRDMLEHILFLNHELVISARRSS